MSERQLKIAEVKAEGRENNRLFRLAQEGEGMSKALIVSYQKQMTQLEKEYDLRMIELNERLQRVVNNAKIHHDIMDKLIEEKEEIHLRLKAAIHLGETQCEYCKKYFTPQGYSRHKNTCSMKPEIKVVKEHKAEMKETRDDLEARKAALQEELKALEKVSAKKLNEEKKPEPEGKVFCDICSKEFSKQRYPAHRKLCEKQETQRLLEAAKILSESKE